MIVVVYLLSKLSYVYASVYTYIYLYIYIQPSNYNLLIGRWTWLSE